MYKIGDGITPWSGLKYAFNKPIQISGFTISSATPVLSYDLSELYDVSVTADIGYYDNELYPANMPETGKWCPLWFYGAYDLPDGSDSFSIQGYIHEIFSDPNWDIQLAIEDKFLIEHYYEIAQSEMILTSNGWLYFENEWCIGEDYIPFNIQAYYKGGN